MKNDIQPPSARADINVTPLVDVCLVLLIIFLVVTPLLHDHGVQPPSTPKPGSVETPEQKVTLTISWPDRVTWYGESWLHDREMLAKLTEIRAREGSKRLVVVADRRLAYGDVRGLLRVARAAGFPGVELAARQDRESK